MVAGSEPAIKIGSRKSEELCFEPVNPIMVARHQFTRLWPVAWATRQMTLLQFRCESNVELDPPGQEVVSHHKTVETMRFTG